MAELRPGALSLQPQRVACGSVKYEIFPYGLPHNTPLHNQLRGAGVVETLSPGQPLEVSGFLSVSVQIPWENRPGLGGLDSVQGTPTPRPALHFTLSED